MDEDIANWILEFLLRQPIDDKIVNGILASLPLANNNNRLKKTILLRKIDSATSKGLIFEKMLDWIEIIEEFDHREGKTASNPMKQAYCAVAVDCTVRFLKNNVEKNGDYFEAVERVWRNRVCKMKGLVSEESNRWLEEIEVAVYDSGVCERILMRNTRDEALKAVRSYLAEGWGSLGPSFLEAVAENFGDAVEGLRDGGGGGRGGDGVVGVVNTCREMVVYEDPQKGSAPARRKHVARKSKRRRGAKVSDADEGHDDESMIMSKRHRGSNISPIDEGNEDVTMNKVSAAATPEVDRVQAAFRPCFVEQDATISLNIHEAHPTVQTLSSTKATGNDTVVEKRTRKAMHTTAEVDRVRKALKSSTEELRAIVKDPLPDALQTAQILSSTIGTVSKSSETVVENQTGPEMHDLKERTENGKERAEENSMHRQDAQGKESQDQKELCRSSRHSLMEPNGTGHTLEWDDEIDILPGGSSTRLSLPIPKENKHSPLKSYVDTKFAKRRARKVWTAVEEDTLRTGVQKFGKGNWKLILHCYREVFQERTDVDLKDKWRNMTRYP